METLSTVLTWPDQAVIELLHGTITDVYERRLINTKFGEKSVQNAVLVDAAGTKTRLNVWSHPDISMYTGKEVYIHSTVNRANKKAGVKVKHGSFTGRDGKEKKTIEIEIDNHGQFQFPEVYNASGKANAGDSMVLEGQKSVAKGGDSPLTHKSPYNDPKAEGMRLGMSFKAAFDYKLKELEASGQSVTEEQFLDSVKVMTPKVVQAVKDLESGQPF